MAHRILMRVRPPFIQYWFKNSVTTITNLAGRLPIRILGKSEEIRKRAGIKSWHSVCQQLWLPGAALVLQNFLLQGIGEAVGTLEILDSRIVLTDIAENDGIRYGRINLGRGRRND